MDYSKWMSNWEDDLHHTSYKVVECKPTAKPKASPKVSDLKIEIDSLKKEIAELKEKIKEMELDIASVL